LENPEGFDAWFDAEAQRYADGSPLELDMAKRWLESDLTDEGPGSEFETAASHWLAPHESFVGRTIGLRISSDARVPYPLTDLGDRRDWHGTTIYDLRMDQLDARLRLIFAAAFGQLSPSARDRMCEKGADLVGYEPDERDGTQLLRLAWAGSKNRSFGAGRDVSEAEQGRRYVEDPEFSRRNAMYVTRGGCEFFGDYSLLFGSQRAFVVGDSFGDFALALALDRLYGSGAWVPAQLLSWGEGGHEPFRALFAEQAKALMDIEAGGRPHVAFTSTSLCAEDLSAIVDAVASRYHWPSEYRQQATVSSPPAMPAEEPMRLCDLGHAFVPCIEPFVGGEAVGAFKTPVPASFDVWEPGRLHWEVDIAIDTDRVPARTLLRDVVATKAGYEDCDVRASSAGVSFSSRRTVAIQGQELRRLPHVRPRLFDCAEAFRRLLANERIQCQPSNVGLYTTRVLGMWGSLDRLAADLGDDAISATLQAFRPKQDHKYKERDERGGRSKLPGLFLASIRRRALTFADCMRAGRWGSADDLRAKLDELGAKGIVRRGFCLKCTNCRFSSWYAIGDIRETFLCGRCGSQQRLRESTWLGDNPEPEWRYLLDEVVFAVIPGLRPVVLALAKLKAESKSFFFAPEMEVRWGKGEREKAEFDLWVIADGKVIVGEAKAGSSLGKNGALVKKAAGKLGHIARVVRADSIVLATTAKSWTPTSTESLEIALRGTRTKMVVLEGLGKVNGD
jgi:hypothetical protein